MLCRSRMRPDLAFIPTNFRWFFSTLPNWSASLLFFMLLGAATCFNAVAADRKPPAYPVKPIRWIVPSAPSGGLDATARLIAQELSQVNNEMRIVIDNRAGSAGLIGLQVAENAQPDGYTMLVKYSDLEVKQAISMANGLKPPYDLNNLTPVIQFTLQPYILSTHASVPVKTVPELIAYAKAKPGTLNIASSGTGGGQHLAGIIFSNRTGIQWTHVPFKGGGAAHIDLLAGHVQIMFVALLTTQEYAKQGRIRYLGATSLKRMTTLPDLPTVAEVLPGFEFISSYGLMAPPKTPAYIVKQMNSTIESVLQSPKILQRFKETGVEPIGGTPESMGQAINKQIKQWEAAVRTSGLRPE